jgi:hypothetical protein
MTQLALAMLCGILWVYIAQYAWPHPRVFRKRRPYGKRRPL